MNAHSRLLLPRRSFFQSAIALGLWPLAAASSAGPATASPIWPDVHDPDFWTRIRQQFSIAPGEAYFNTGTIGACPRPVIDAVAASMREMERTICQYDYRPEHPEYIAGYRPQDELRQKAGAVINARGHDVALTQNATMGINLVANGLDLKPGDEVLMTDQEHPGAMGAWDLRAKRQGIVVKKLVIPVPVPGPEPVIKIFTEAIGPRTRVLAIPHITSHYGIVMPVQELCALGRARGLFTLVDGAQAIGQLAVDVKKMDCDAYACSPHKWLLAPPGNGLLYVKTERQNEIWATLASAQWDNYTPEGGVFRLMQFGTASAALLAGLDAAIDFHTRIGPERIHQRILGMANRLREGLRAIPNVSIASPLDAAMSCAMVTYGVRGMAAMKLQDELWARKQYRVRAQSGEMVRQSVHIYNSPEEIEGTLETIRLLARA